MSLLAELKRRNVIRMAGLYLVGAWLVVQIAETLLPIFHTPDWVLQSLVVLLALGFIPALVFSWLYELTPEGLKRDAEVVPEQSIAATTGKRMDRLLLVGMLAVVGAIAADRYWPRSAPTAEAFDTTTPAAAVQSAATPEQSIAVLAFVDLSPGKDQEYFADGISEEILNALVRIPKLKVAGRTSSFAYKGRNEDLRTIGDALGVNHVLEGSVRRSGDKLRIAAQLIRSEDGFHLWSETFDRELADIFAVQDEIARSVADKLQLSLGLGAKTLVTDTTDDIGAYENYLQARQLLNQRGYRNLRDAKLLLTATVARDPAYAPAWSTLAVVYNLLESYAPADDFDAFFARWNDTGRAAARRAVALGPDSAQSQEALGSLLAARFDWIPAFAALDRAVALSPDNENILDTTSQYLLMAGYTDEARALSLRAVAKEPRVAIFRNTLGNTHQSGGDVRAAAEQYRQAIAIDPGLGFPVANLVFLDICIGEADEALELIHQGIERGSIPDEFAAPFRALTQPADMGAIERAFDALGEANPYLASIGWCLYAPDRRMAALAAVWEAPQRNDPSLFYLPWATLRQDPRWKAQVRKDGLLDLWRVRGFPPQCKPVGDDDFECTAPEIGL